MKFTCENCGAQYLIADSKLGERGVKVRCKKCSYVIILRPFGWTDKKDAKEEAPSADIDPSPTHDRPIAARAARERDAVAALPSFPTGEIERDIGVAPDLGLSQEFAALGFSDEQMSSGDLDSSPFSMRAMGGSLDELPGFNLAAHAGEHASERASSDQTDVLDRRTHRASLGSSVPDIEDDRVGDPTHVERVEMEEDTPLEHDGGTGELNAALAKVQRNELLEMRSSLELDLEGLSSAFDPKGKKGKGAESKSDNHKPNFSALNALASDSPSDPDYNIVDEARAEAEITGAFEAMFEVPTDDGFDKNKLPTRVFDTEAMEQVEAEQAIARPASYVGHPSEWYVAIDDQQVGPLTKDEVRERWEAGELAADSLCWRQGLGDWQPIKSTTELRDHLGSMEDRERTVVSNLQEEDSVPGGAVPPQISIHPEPAEHSMGASSIAAEVGMDEPSWRPSAASALASLAAEELASASSSAAIPVKITSDVAVGAALPATSDALEKLLAGAGSNSAAASQFGAAEKSESSVRPLPRRAEAITSMPLRDPMESRSRTGLMLPLSILGAAVVLVGGIIFALSGKDEPPAVAMAPQPTNPQMGMVGGNPPPPAPETPPPPAGAKAEEAPPPLREVKTEAKAPVEGLAKAEEKAEPEDEEEDSEAKKKKGTKKKKSEKGDPRPRKEKRELVDDSPPPTRRQKDPEELEVDDLLGGGGRTRPSERRSVEDDLPKQLDDGDILKVLRTNRKAIIECVKKQTSADSSVSGTMMVNMVITKAGQTTRITISPDRYTKTVAGKCVSTAVRNWKFPKFSGPNMPIDFPVRIR